MGDKPIKSDRPILIIDFGGQYCHLISRRIRDLGVYSEILPFDSNVEKIKSFNPKGIVLSGGPASVYESGAPILKRETFEFIIESSIPLIGLCYGHHLIIQLLKGKVIPKEYKEYGKTELKVLKFKDIFTGLEEFETVWMSHGDQITELPQNFEVYGSTDSCTYAAYGNSDKKIYGLQFHPEVQHTIHGNKILSNFIFKICGCKGTWKMENWIPNKIKELRDEIGDEGVILGLSGGVDSSVVAVLLQNAIGGNVHPIFVNNGLLRKNEVEDIIKLFRDDLKFQNFHHIDAEELFLEKLKNVKDPEEKRKIIGLTFIEVFEKKAEEITRKYKNIKYFAQGTIFPDRVESAKTSKSSTKIKTHHNTALPEDMKLKLIEPLRDLYKDEVRKIGKQLGLRDEIIWRQPFPGPGLAVRILGSISKESLSILRKADWILREVINSSEISDDLWQYFVALLPVKAVGVMGDFRTYEFICAIRAVESKDAMTASFAKIDWEILELISTRIVNEVKGINRVLYDITNKPPGTIEFE
jgi:GMP synthase (glutamine-hydrolysing)